MLNKEWNNLCIKLNMQTKDNKIRKYSKEIFKILSNRHMPEAISYFYTHLFNHIVFLNATKAVKENGLYVIPNNTGVKLYFKEIVI